MKLRFKTHQRPLRQDPIDHAGTIEASWCGGGKSRKLSEWVAEPCLANLDSGGSVMQIDIEVSCNDKLTIGRVVREVVQNLLKLAAPQIIATFAFEMYVICDQLQVV